MLLLFIAMKLDRRFILEEAHINISTKLEKQKKQNPYLSDQIVYNSRGTRIVRV